MGELNIQATDSILKDFREANDYINLIKSNTCFKAKVFRIDLIWNNRKYYFKHSNSIETDISHYYHLIYTVFKTTFSKARPKPIHYTKYKTFNFESFKVILGAVIGRCSANSDDFNQIFTATSDQHIPKKEKFD